MHMRYSAHAKRTDERPRTLFEKIIDRHVLSTDFTGAGSEPGTGIFVRADWRFIHEYYTGMCSHMLHSAFGRPLQLHEPKSMVVFEDHTSYVSASRSEEHTSEFQSLMRISYDVFCLKQKKIR